LPEGKILGMWGESGHELGRERLRDLPLAAVVSSPLIRCRQTLELAVPTSVPELEEGLTECGYGDWEGQSLKTLAKEPLWRVVQAQASAVRFPGDDGESMLDMQHRAVSAVRDWNARLGKDAAYVMCSHGDVIKAVITDSLGMHLDMCQRIQVDPCSLTVIRYTPLRPFLIRMNDTGGGTADLARRAAAGRAAADGRAAVGEGDAMVGGGAGG
jgi:probable phosphomutase (TIGR03848 family)